MGPTTIAKLSLHMENRMKTLLPLILAAGFLSLAPGLAQNPSKQPAAPRPAQEAAAPPAQPAEETRKPVEDVGAGYLKVANQKKAVWLKLDADTLAEVEKLGKASACGNEKLI